MSQTAQIWKRQANDSLYRARLTPWPDEGRQEMVYTIEWNKVISAHAAGILGENGAARFREFRDYPEGWDFGAGKALTRNSIHRMETFLQQCPHFMSEPSLFLTDRGNLMLGWEDETGNPIELEFAREGFILYLAASDEETTYPVAALPSLLEALPHVSAHGAS